MPKPIHYTSTFSLNELKKQVSLLAGFPIWTKADCLKLSKLIEEKTKKNVSESTLYRFFVQKDKPNKPYIHTLDILALYCGAKDWHEFEIKVNENEKFDFSYGKIHLENREINSLLQVCIHQNELKALYNFTEQFPSDVDFDKKIRIGYEFYQALATNENSNDTFFKNFSSLPLIRETLFELMADPDFSLKDYENGLVYYANSVRPENSDKELEAFIFSNALLFRHNFVTKKYAKALELGKTLYEKFDLNETQLNKLAIFPKTRYLAYKLFYLELLEQKMEKLKYEEELLFFCQENITKWSLFELRVGFYNIAEAFHFTKTDQKTITSFKTIFSKLFETLPSGVAEKPLHKILPYVQENGLLRLKQLKQS
jgi:hypothetical protein